LRTRYGHILLIYYDLFSHGAVSGRLLRSARILEHLIFNEVAGREIANSGALASVREKKHQVLKLLSRTCGALFNHFPRFFSRIQGPEFPRTIRPCSVLICGFVESDRRAQTGLIKRLRRVHALDFRWAVFCGNRLPVTADEKVENQEVFREEADLFDTFSYSRWLNPFMAKCSAMDFRCRIGRILRDVLEEQRWGRIHDWFAGEIVGANRNLRMKYRDMASIIDQYQPSLVVLYSILEEHAYVRHLAWARKVPVLRFPHGVERYGRKYIGKEAEFIGVPGRAAYTALREHRAKRMKRIKITGGMHITGNVQDALRDRQVEANESPQPVLLYLVTYGRFGYPDTEKETENDLVSLSEVSLAHKVKLMLRCHPRQSEWNLDSYRLIRKHCRDLGLTWHFTDSSKSLIGDLDCCQCAVIRAWSGSAISALMAGVPLMGWMPRPGIPDSDANIQRLPICCCEAEQLLIETKRLRDSVYREETLRQQHELLCDLIENPYGDPFDLSIELIRDAAMEMGLMKREFR
jgi:hypothetical protein